MTFKKTELSVKKIFATSILLGLLIPSLAMSKDYTVGSTSELRQALEDANANGQSDNIFLKDGIYKTTDDNLGGFTFYDSEDHSLTIQGEGNGAILDGDSTTQVLKISGSSSFDFLIKNITIRNGNVNGYTNGAGLYIEAVKPTIINCVFYNNKSESGDGGAISIDQVTEANIINSTIYNNYADRGAGIYSRTYSLLGFGRLIVTNSILYDNKLTGSIFSKGSAIEVNKGELLLVNSTLARNSQNAVSTDEDSTFINNIFYENDNDILFSYTGYDYYVHNNYIDYSKLENGDIAIKKNNIQGVIGDDIFKAGGFKLSNNSKTIDKGIFTENSTFKELVVPFIKNFNYDSEEETIRYQEYISNFKTDIEGNERVKNNFIDLGALEYTESDEPNPDTGNNNPIAKDDTSSTDINTSVSINVLENDTDADNDLIILKSFDLLSKESGTISRNGNKLLYTPLNNFKGNDSFNYLISDGNGGESSGVVTVNVVDTAVVVPPTGGETCAIAAIVSGSYLFKEIKMLRDFRDKYLLTNKIGSFLVKDVYYEYSPPIANYMSSHENTRTVTRWAITPVVYSVKYPSLAILLMGLLIALFFYSLKSRREATWLNGKVAAKNRKITLSC